MRKKTKVIMTCAFKNEQRVNYKGKEFTVVDTTINGDHYLVTIEVLNECAFLIVADYELLEYNMDLVIEQEINGKKYYVIV